MSGNRNGWTQWNVSLWLHNDEGLYRMMLDFVRRAKTKDIAALEIYTHLQALGILKTPDGAHYTVSNIRKAIAEEL